LRQSVFDTGQQVHVIGPIIGAVRLAFDSGNIDLHVHGSGSFYWILFLLENFPVHSCERREIPRRIPPFSGAVRRFFSFYYLTFSEIKCIL
jgi:hypothetical protein